MASQLFTTVGSNTWNWPAGVTSATVELLGGGGFGGTASGNPSTGGGGKGGGYAKVALTKGAEASLAIVVGAGGVASTATIGQDSTVTQNGVLKGTGSGGVGGANASVNSTNGAGATLTNGTPLGDFTWVGGNGGTGNFTSGTQGSGAGGGAGGPTGVGGAASVNTGGTANTGAWGDGVTARGSNGANGVGDSTVGAVGGNYGGGGSGGKANTATDRLGGNGGQGIALVTWTTGPIPKRTVCVGQAIRRASYY